MVQMSGEGHLEVRRRISSQVFRGEDDECTSSARTRPFSFDEIMKRRKNKELKVGASDGEVMIGSEKRNSGEPERSMLKESCESMKDSPFSSKEHATPDVPGLTSKKERSKLKKGKDLVSEKNIGDDGISLNQRAKPSRDKNDRNVGGEVSMDKSRRYSSKQFDNGRYTGNTDRLSRSLNESSSLRYHGGRGNILPAKENRKHQSDYEERDRLATDNRTSKKQRYIRKGEFESSEREIPKKGLSDSHYGDSDKRSQSRSGHGSHSGSPTAHKQQHYHSIKDSSARDLAAADRHRHVTNGSSSKGYYGRHNDQSSRLGGYSPRKRKSDLAANSTIPTKGSPEKRSKAWDLPPTVKNGDHVGSSKASVQDLARKIDISTPRTLTTSIIESKPVTLASFKNLLVLKTTSIDSVQLTQATRPKRRLYVENLPASASETDVMKCLNDFFLLSGMNHIHGTQPCISCIINKEKGQAVVEFLTPEDATSALAFDGKSFSGSIIKLRRPKEFVEALTGIQEKPTAMPPVASVDTVVFNSPHKIFIGGISKAISCDMFKEIVASFGVLKAYHFEFNKDMDGPLAFVEFADHSITPMACAGLNGMKLGGRVLTVVQAFPNVSDEDIGPGPPLYEIPQLARALLQSPTPVLKLLNVFKEESYHLLTETEVLERLEDVRFECTRFGTIKSVNFVKYDKHHDECKPITGGAVVMNPEENFLPISHSSSTDADTIELVNQNVKHHDSPAGGSPRDNLLDDSEPQNAGHVESIDGTLLRVDQREGEKSAEPLSGHEEKDEVAAIERECIILGDKTNEQPVEAIDGTAERTDNSEVDPHDLGADQLFENGSVLVEFMRTEAASAAAHCLNGRLYGDQRVWAAYVPHDLYMAKFPAEVLQ